MRGFVGGDLGLVLKREPDVVEPFQQAMTRELVNFKLRRKALRIFHGALFQIDGQLIRRNFGGLARNLIHFVLGQDHCEQAIFTQLLAKMSANDGAITARNPKSASAQTACSRDEPQPKFFPATKMLGPK